MPIENADFIGQLDEDNPFNTDNPQEGAAQIRLTKKATRQTFPNIDGEVDCTQNDLNQLTGVLLTELMPVGSVLMWATTTPPDGWLQCDGSVIDPGFLSLIALVGANTPNLDNAFVRGSSPARLPLTVEGENVGSHDHNYGSWSENVDNFLLFQNGNRNIVTTFIPNINTHDNPTGENRPANTALMYIIKT